MTTMRAMVTGAAAAALVTGAALAAEAAKAPDGAALFKAKCAMCHGPAGKGNVKMLKPLKSTAADLDLTDDATQKKSDADLTKIVADGSPTNKSMAGFGKKLKADAIAAVVAQIRVFAKAAAGK